MITLEEWGIITARAWASLPPPRHNPCFETHPTWDELMRFADDGGRIPENDRIPAIRIGTTVRIRLPRDFTVNQTRDFTVTS